MYELLEPYPVSKICLYVIRLLPWNVSVLNFTVFFGSLVCMMLKHRPLQWPSARRHISKLLHITSVFKVITRLYGVITRKTTVLFTGQYSKYLYNVWFPNCESYTMYIVFLQHFCRHNVHPSVRPSIHGGTAPSGPCRPVCPHLVSSILYSWDL